MDGMDGAPLFLERDARVGEISERRKTTLSNLTPAHSRTYGKKCRGRLGWPGQHTRTSRRRSPPTQMPGKIEKKEKQDGPDSRYKQKYKPRSESVSRQVLCLKKFFFFLRDREDERYARRGGGGSGSGGEEKEKLGERG